MTLKMVIPKGRQFAKVVQLLEDVGIQMNGSQRSYRPVCNDKTLSVKLLKSQNIPPLVSLGQHDIGFAGQDWIREQDAQVVPLIDLGFDPVRVVACIPEDWDWNQVRRRRVIAVSEYRNLCCAYLQEQGIDFTFLQSYGATEVFPPEDADVVVDNSSTGATLQAHRLKVVDELMDSATVFIANPRALEHPAKRELIDNLVLLFNSVIEGRRRILLEMNCPDDRFEAIVAILPAMKAPTIARLYQQPGYAVKAAVPKEQVKDLIPRLRKLGATDILETPIRKVIP